MIVKGTAEICNWLFVDVNTTQLFPDAIATCYEDWSKGGGGTRRILGGQLRGRRTSECLALGLLLQFKGML